MLDFLYTAVSWVLLRWHQLFTFLGLSQDSGLNWALSIVFLVVTARLLLFRLFVKQVHYQRHMQEMQPKIQELREKYKNDRRRDAAADDEAAAGAGLQPARRAACRCSCRSRSSSRCSTCCGTCRTRPRSVTAAARPSSPPADAVHASPQPQTCSAAKAKLFGAPLAGVAARLRRPRSITARRRRHQRRGSSPSCWC